MSEADHLSCSFLCYTHTWHDLFSQLAVTRAQLSAEDMHRAPVLILVYAY